jgi:hypothetical protein
MANEHINSHSDAKAIGAKGINSNPKLFNEMMDMIDTKYANENVEDIPWVKLPNVESAYGFVIQELKKGNLLCVFADCMIDLSFTGSYTGPYDFQNAVTSSFIGTSFTTGYLTDSNGHHPCLIRFNVGVISMEMPDLKPFSSIQWPARLNFRDIFFV